MLRRAPIHTQLESLIKSADVDQIQTVLKHCQQIPSQLYVLACQTGNLDTLQALYNLNPKCFDDVGTHLSVNDALCLAAVYGGSLKCFQFVLERGVKVSTCCMTAAIDLNRLDILGWWCKHVFSVFIHQPNNQPHSSNDYSVHTIPAVIGHSAMLYAIQQGNLDAIHCMLSNGLDWCFVYSKRAIKHLHILKYIYNRYGLQHFDDWLSSSTTLLETLRWFTQVGCTIKHSSNLIMMAAAENKLDVIKYVVEELKLNIQFEADHPYKCLHEFNPLVNCIKNLVLNNNSDLSCVEYLIHKLKVPIHSMMLVTVCLQFLRLLATHSSSNLDVLKSCIDLLIASGAKWDPVRDMKLILKNDNVIGLMFFTRTYKPSSFLLTGWTTRAVKNEAVQCLLYLLMEFSLFMYDATLDQALYAVDMLYFRSSTGNQIEPKDIEFFESCKFVEMAQHHLMPIMLCAGTYIQPRVNVSVVCPSLYIKFAFYTQLTQMLNSSARSVMNESVPIPIKLYDNVVAGYLSATL